MRKGPLLGLSVSLTVVMQENGRSDERKRARAREEEEEG